MARETMLVFGLHGIYMEGKMSKLRKMFAKTPLWWGVVLVILFLTAVTVYAIMPGISLNSPTSFPVDI